MGIMAVGEAPGCDEDEQGIQWRGKAGGMLRRSLARYGVDLDRDCVMANAVACRPVDEKGHNREPTPDEVRHCRQRLEGDIEAAGPGLILALGSTAIAAVLSDAPPGLALNATTMHGRVVPCRRWNVWVACGMHPAWYVRQDGQFDGRMDDMLAKALATLAARPELPPTLEPEAFEIVEDAAMLEGLLGRLGRGEAEVALDYETTGLDPWARGFKVLSLAVTDDPARGWCIPLDHPHALWGGQRDRVVKMVRQFLQSQCPKVIQNWQFEELVSRVALGVGVNNVVCDTMVREHVLDNRRGVCSQEFQEYVRYGDTRKGAMDRRRMAREWLDDLARYNALDVRYCLRWKRDQDLELDDDLRRAYGLFHEAIPVLAGCTERGLRV
ncbi:MAG TPA: uracil-DNA glycosylase family protein, partial [Phycisphaerae bacterium]|nr:uracil-DNA glycosylase family protein [Phycisphaerae bacterium]